MTILNLPLATQVGFAITVKDHVRLEMSKVIQGADGVLQPTGEVIAVTDDILAALIERLARNDAHQ